MPYLIDGHNLIAKLPDIDIADPNDEAKLVTRLRGFAAKTSKQCTVIFDHGIPGGASSLSNRAVKVIFAAAHHTNADNLLKRRIRKTKDARNWTIVSSDNEVLNCGRQYQMKVMTSAQFVQELSRSRTPETLLGEEVHPQVTDDEIDEWLDVFGEN